MNRQLRLLHIIASCDPRGGGPIEGIIQQFSSRLASNVHTDVVTLDSPDDPWVLTAPVPVIPLGPKKLPYGAMRRLLPWLRYGYTPHLVPWLRRHARDYDVAVVNGLWNYAALGARRALVKGDTPYVVFTHGMLDPWFRKSAPIKTLAKQVFWWFSEGPLLRQASAVLFTTEEECILARNAFWPYRLREQVVGYGTADVTGVAEAQIRAFRDIVPTLANRRYILFLSRIHPKKGCDLLIDAFEKVAKRHPDVDLVIAGPDQLGCRRGLETRAHSLNISHRIHWPGMLAGDQKWGAFRACDAFVLPSHQENFGIVVAEAMAAGRPILITDKVNIWREVKAGGGGFVEPDTVEGVTRLLEKLLDLSSDQLNRMGASARATFLERYEIATNAKDLTNFLWSLVPKEENVVHSSSAQIEPIEETLY